MLREVPVAVQRGILSILNLRQEQLLNFSYAGGGCINHGGRLTTSHGNFFLKWNDSGKFPGMFNTEAKGLRLLRSTNSIDIPEVIEHGENENHQYLILEYIEQKKRCERYWRTLGNQLANLHRFSADTCGLDHDNYIGSLQQFNQRDISWVDFFIEQRLEVQLKMAVDRGFLDAPAINKFNLLYSNLPTIIPLEKHALLHGDLWSGNVMINENGEPCIFDPAVYYGSREADIAMTHLFGGFDNKFYEAYDEAFPLLPGYRDRVALYNLYPLLVHLNLFGASYRAGIMSALDRFI